MHTALSHVQYFTCNVKLKQTILYTHACACTYYVHELLYIVLFFRYDLFMFHQK